MADVAPLRRRGHEITRLPAYEVRWPDGCTVQVGAVRFSERMELLIGLGRLEPLWCRVKARVRDEGICAVLSQSLP